MLVIICIGDNTAVGSGFRDRIPGRIIRIGRYCPAVIRVGHQLILLIIAVRGNGSVFPCFCRHISKLVIAVALCTLCRGFLCQLILAVVGFLTA